MTCATSVPILIFLGLSVLDLGPMYATDRRQTSDAHHRLMLHPVGAESCVYLYTGWNVNQLVRQDRLPNMEDGALLCPAPRVGALSDDACLTCLTSVCRVHRA